MTQRHKNRDAAAVGPLKGAQRRRTNPVPGPAPGPGPCSDPVHRRCRFPFQHAWTIADDSEHALPSRSHSRSMLSFPTKTLPWRTLLAPHAVWGMPQAGRQANALSLSLSHSHTHVLVCVRVRVREQLLCKQWRLHAFAPPTSLARVLCAFFVASLGRRQRTFGKVKTVVKILVEIEISLQLPVNRCKCT